MNAGLLANVGRLTGLAAGLLIAFQVLSMSRIPVIDRVLGGAGPRSRTARSARPSSTSSSPTSSRSRSATPRGDR